ncbi:uncharacterized protein F4807DRAFT_98921 [Annulohypoxylon truncatum]|uniref:uncharacterized protein n=1 Tax=Annulohypoxylon truncatum TaxID=327061 RepID=UPI0020077EF5|nr:uncharacterized protein F4807DRAFT_98921 [Annulohypoxylon truncatum]KAI1209165.1 hypothetical protein F4807DRAFT_98921 [Annulohypoxylon truncatum]
MTTTHLYTPTCYSSPRSHLPPTGSSFYSLLRRDFEAVYQLIYCAKSRLRSVWQALVTNKAPHRYSRLLIYQRFISSKRSLDHYPPPKLFKMCKVYHITYSCGCKEIQEAPCAESPNTFGTCAGGAEIKSEDYPGPCDKCA